MLTSSSSPACLIGLGANVGDRRQTLDRAVELLQENTRIHVIARSRWRETSPVGGPAGQEPYLNGAVLLETSLDPFGLLDVLASIEAALGRQRSVRWGPRTLDLDLLLYDQLVLNTPRLVLPHPRMAWRRFVLEPAVEIAGPMVHPTTGWTLNRLLDHLDHAFPYVAITGPIGAGKTELAKRLAETTGALMIPESIDAEQLKAFYANPAGNAWATEIEFLFQRARLLAIDLPCWTRQDRWIVTDFWFDQSLAFAKVWLSAEEFPVFNEKWRELAARVMPPKLIVVLDAPTEQLLERIRRRGRSGEEKIDAGVLDRLRDAIDDQARKPDRAPVLLLRGEDRDRSLEELRAAIEAMRATTF